MNYRIYKENDFRISNWTGGKTKQLAIFPEDGSYLERNFLWRLSTATCGQEESDFSVLPDFDRVLMVLEGNVVLAHQDVRAVRLGELEQDRFDGAYHTKSFGKITDYNLMVAKGNQGFLDAITLKEVSQKLIPEDHEEVRGYEKYTLGLFCRDGYATVTVNGETLMLTPGQQFILNTANGETGDISVMGDGNIVRAQIFYNYCPEELGPTVIPREKGTFDDFRMCAYLANTQFRGAKYIFKKMQTQWIDEELSSAVRKIERLYIPFVICMAGCLLVTAIGVNRFQGIQWIVAFAIWLLADMFAVSPLIYFAIVPKPVRAHIKDINNLTPYEQGVYEREQGTNERIERLLKKYKNTGKESYDENGNRLDKTF